MRWLVGILAVCLVSCAVVNVYVTFQEEKIKKAADDLLGPPEPSTESKGQSFLNVDWVPSACAEDVAVSRDLKTSSPVLDEIKQRRAAWQGKLGTYKSQGFVGEANDFTVAIKALPGGAAANDVKDLVQKENRERNAMIVELMKINNAAPSQETTFRDIFAEVMIGKYTPSGAWIQKPDGQWVKKE